MAFDPENSPFDRNADLAFMATDSYLNDFCNKFAYVGVAHFKGALYKSSLQFLYMYICSLDIEKRLIILWRSCVENPHEQFGGCRGLFTAPSGEGQTVSLFVRQRKGH